jgi:hypothetical protein
MFQNLEDIMRSQRVNLRMTLRTLRGCILILTVAIQHNASAQTVQNNLYATDGTVMTTLVSGNTVYIGGNFTRVYPQCGGGGALSMSSGWYEGPVLKIDGVIYAVAPDGAGGWFIGGDFTHVGGSPRGRLAHIQPDKSLDPAWTPNADSTVRAIAVSNSAVYVGGDFSWIGAHPRTRIAALNRYTGLVITTWSPPVPDGTVYTLALTDSVVYVGGAFTHVGGQTRYHMAAIDVSTGILSFFDPYIDGDVYVIIISGKKIFVGGSFGHIGGHTGIVRSNLAALNWTGGTYTSEWLPNPDYEVRTLAVSGSVLYAGGLFNHIRDDERNRIAGIDISDGSIGQATDFVALADDAVNAIAVSGSTVYAGGEFATIGGQSRYGIAELDGATGDATGWDPQADGVVRALAVSGTTVYAGGDFSHIGGPKRNRIAAFDASTGIPTSCDPNADGIVYTLAISGSTLYAGGYFSNIGGRTRNNIAAIDVSDGSIGGATSWDPNIDGAVYALATSGSTVYAGGAFVWVGSKSRSGIAAIDASNGLGKDWDPHTNGYVYALAVSGSTVYAGGAFTYVADEQRNRIAAIDASTGLATSWNPDASDVVYTIAPTGSVVYAGGAFKGIGGRTRNRIAAIDAFSGLPTDWDPDASSTVKSVVPFGTTVYVGGSFLTIGGQSRSMIAALDCSTGQATEWDPSADGTVETIALTTTTVYAGGAFSTVGGTSHPGLAGMDDPWFVPQPVITSIGDVESDQGGMVRLKWNKIAYDGIEGPRQTTHYGVWRKIPPEGQAGSQRRNSLWKTMNDTLATMYDFIVTVPAVQSPSYNIVAPTFADSSGMGTNHTRFVITAHTADPTVFYLSAEDSGYSVDNIPPSAPGGASINGLPDGRIALQWNPNRTDHDVSHYTVYCAATSGVPLTASEVMCTTTDTAAVDSSAVAGQQYFYRITTVDIHGNESSPTDELSQVALPAQLVSASASIVRDRDVVLQWVTLCEEPNAGFEVQRRTPDKQEWTLLGLVEGQGTSSSRHTYSYTDRITEPGVYSYRVRQMLQNGGSVLFFEQEVEVELPKEFALTQNYPNPFNPTTTIEYDLPKETPVRLKVYDNLGREVKTLVSTVQQPGYYKVVFDAHALSSGVYYYRIQAGEFTKVKRLVLLK